MIFIITFLILSQILSASEHKPLIPDAQKIIREYIPIKDGYSTQEMYNKLHHYIKILYIQNSKFDIKINIYARLKLGSLLSSINLELHSNFIRQLCENISYDDAVNNTINLLQFAQMQFILAETYFYSKEDNRNKKAVIILQNVLTKKEELLDLDNLYSDELLDSIEGLLASIYYWGGNGIKKNYAKSAKYYENLLDRKTTTDIIMPLIFLGEMYINGGNRLQQDYTKAYGFLQIAIEQPNIDETTKLIITKLLKKLPIICTIQ